MADLSKIKLNGTEYNIKDAVARANQTSFLIPIFLDESTGDYTTTANADDIINHIDNCAVQYVQDENSSPANIKMTTYGSETEGGATIYQLVGNYTTSSFSTYEMNVLTISIVIIKPENNDAQIYMIYVDQGNLTNSIKHFSPFVVSGTANFSNKIEVGTDTTLTITNVNKTCSQILSAANDDQPILFILSKSDFTICFMLDYAGFYYNRHYFSGTYNYFQGTQSSYNKGPFTITIEMYQDNDTDVFNGFLTFDKNYFALKSEIPTVPTSDITANTNARHTHSNKALLDTYTQTEANLADAVSKKHTHSNKNVLDNITVANVTTWNGQKSPYYLTVTDDGEGNLSVDKTPTEIDALSAAGYDVHLRCSYDAFIYGTVQIDARYITKASAYNGIALFTVSVGGGIIFTIIVKTDKTIEIQMVDLGDSIDMINYNLSELTDDLPLIVTGTCNFATSLGNGIDTVLSITNVSNSVENIANAVTAHRPVYFVLTNDDTEIMLQYSAFYGDAYYFTNAYDPFTQTAYDNESFNITVKASSSNNTDSFIYIITYNKNVFATKSEVTSQVNAALGNISSFDTEVVQSLPASGNEGTIYFTANNHGTNDAYDEYMYISNGSSFNWEKIGSTAVNLTNYVLSDDLAYVAFTGDYNNLNNTPTIPIIPSNVSAFNNDANYVTASNIPKQVQILVGDNGNVIDTGEMSDLGSVTGSDVYSQYISGNKNNVVILQHNGKNYYYQSGGNNSDAIYYNAEAKEKIIHSRNISSYQVVTESFFDGDYNSLSNKPTLFDGDYNSLTNKPAAISVTQVVTSGVKIAEIAGVNIYAPAYANGDAVAY